MKKPTKKEIAQVLADRDFWRDLAKRLGYRVYGFTERSGATLIRPGGSHFHVERIDRDAIMNMVPELELEYLTYAQLTAIVADIAHEVKRRNPSA